MVLAIMQSKPKVSHDGPERGVLLVVKTALLMGVYREVAGTFTVMFIGGFNLTIVEVILAALGIALIQVSPRSLRSGVDSGLVLCFAFLYLVSLARGLMTTPDAAITSIRANGAMPAILVWSLFISPQSLWHERVQRAIVNAGWILAVLVFLRIIMGPSFLLLVQVADEMDINDGGRALTAQGAVMLAAAGAISLARYLQGQSSELTRPRYQLATAFAFFAAVAVTKQGTSTLAMLAAGCIVLGLTPGKTRWTRATFILIGVLFLGGVGIGLQDSQILVDVNSSLPSFLKFDLTQRSGNFTTRQDVWAGLLVDMENWSIVSKFLGLPAGQRPVIFVYIWSKHGTLWEVSIHSMYYGLLPVIGIVGLSIYVLLLIALIFKNFYSAFSGAGMSQQASAISIALIAIIIILGLSYEIRNETTIFLALAMASQLRKSDVDPALTGAKQTPIGTRSTWRPVSRRAGVRFDSRNSPTSGRENAK